MVSKNGKKLPEGGLERLSSSLYSRENAPQPEIPVIVKKNESVEVTEELPREWSQIDTNQTEAPKDKFVNKKTMAYLKKFLIFSLLFFVVSAGLATFVFLRGGNQISTENVTIDITGPISTGAGEVLTYDVVFTNNNNIALEGANVLLEYPKGTRTPEGDKELVRESRFIGDIPPGETVKLHRQAMFFGEANEGKSVVASIEYRVKDSSATYFKEKNYAFTISTAPIRLSVKTLNEVISGQEFEFTIEVTSNSPSIVSDLLLRAEYPLGYTYISSTPAPTFGNNVFALGDLSPGEKRIFRIKGNLKGQEQEERNFAFNLGTKSKTNEKVIDTLFVSTNQTVAINRPFISVNLSFDGKTGENLSAEAGSRIGGTITWTNNLPNRITDLEIQAKITGDFDRKNVIALRGFYRSSDDTILYNRTTDSSLSIVDPEESGSADFVIEALPASSLVYSSGKGHGINVVISLKARRLSDANVPEEITSTLTRTVKFNSDITLTGNSLYFTGPFKNQGPIPPTAEQATTYTVVWSLTNSLNDISNTQVRATLPTYVTWVGSVSPASESVRYDSLSNEVVWNVGDVDANVGYGNTPREAAFQLSVVPSLSQIGQAPTIINQAIVTAVDRYTQTSLRDSTREVTTAIQDAFMQPGNATKVVQ